MANSEKEIWQKIFQIYQEFPHLWDKNNKHYFNKSLREESLKVLLEILKDFDKTATIQTLKKKIENFRTCYFRELKKVKASLQTGSGAEEVFTPSLWYFDHLHFLTDNNESMRNGIDTLDQTENGSQETEANDHKPTSPKRTKKLRNRNQTEREFHETVKQLLHAKEDQYDIMGKSIAAQLREAQIDKKQLMFFNKVMAEAIIYATLGNLTQTSTVNLGPNLQTNFQPPYQPPCDSYKIRPIQSYKSQPKPSLSSFSQIDPNISEQLPSSSPSFQMELDDCELIPYSSSFKNHPKPSYKSQPIPSLSSFSPIETFEPDRSPSSSPSFQKELNDYNPIPSSPSFKIDSKPSYNCQPKPSLSSFSQIDPNKPETLPYSSVPFKIKLNNCQPITSSTSFKTHPKQSFKSSSPLIQIDLNKCQTIPSSSSSFKIDPNKQQPLPSLSPSFKIKLDKSQSIPSTPSSFKILPTKSSNMKNFVILNKKI